MNKVISAVVLATFASGLLLFPASLHAATRTRTFVEDFSTAKSRSTKTTAVWDSILRQGKLPIDINASIIDLYSQTSAEVTALDVSGNTVYLGTDDGNKFQTYSNGVLTPVSGAAAAIGNNTITKIIHALSKRGGSVYFLATSAPSLIAYYTVNGAFETVSPTGVTVSGSYSSLQIVERKLFMTTTGGNIFLTNVDTPSGTWTDFSNAGSKTAGMKTGGENVLIAWGTSFKKWLVVGKGVTYLFDEKTWTSVRTPWGSETITSLASNGRGWLIGGTGLYTYNGNVFYDFNHLLYSPSDEVPFSSVSNILWSGSDWIVSIRRTGTVDGATLTASHALYRIDRSGNQKTALNYGAGLDFTSTSVSSTSTTEYQFGQNSIRRGTTGWYLLANYTEPNPSPQPALIFGQMGYTANTNKILQSGRVNSPGSRVTQAKLTAETSRPTGTTITFQLSNDNGRTWKTVTSGGTIKFTKSGRHLKWRAFLSTTNLLVTPIVDKVTISYR